MAAKKYSQEPARTGSQAATDIVGLGVSNVQSYKIPLDSASGGLLNRLDIPVAAGTGYNQLISRDKGGQVFNVKAYGLVGDGATDNSAAFATLLATVTTAGGGIVYFPTGNYRFLSQIVIPNDGASPPTQVPIVLQGAGSFFDGVWTGTPTQGSILDIRSSTAPAKIDTRGRGVLVFQDIVIMASAGTGPMVQTTNTTIITDNVCLFGSAAGAAAVNDGFVLGGTTTAVDGTINAAFQGYGTDIKDVYFGNIRRAVYARTFANSVSIHNNTVSTNCGFTTGACFDIEGNAGVGAGANGAFIHDNTVEMVNYKYGIQATNGSQGVYGPNGFYDAAGTTTAYLRFETNAPYNFAIAGFHDDAKTFVSDATSPSTQSYINSHQSQTSLWSQPQLVTTTDPRVKTTTGSTGWIIEASSTTEKWFQQIVAPGLLDQMTVPVGGSGETVTRTSRTSATVVNFQIGIGATSGGSLTLANATNTNLTSIGPGVPANTRRFDLPITDPTAGQAIVASLAGSTITLSYATLTTGTVTGTGVAQQVAFWSGTSALTGDTGFTIAGTGATAQLTVTLGYNTGANGVYGWAAEVWQRQAADTILLRDVVTGTNPMTYRVARSFTSSAAYIASQMTWDATNSFITFGGFRVGTGAGVDVNHMGTDAVGANQAGSNVYLSAGRATGTGVGGAIAFQVGTTSGASSSTVSAWFIGASMALSGTSMNLNLGGGGSTGTLALGNSTNSNQAQITTAAQSGNRTLTLPIVGGNRTFAFLEEAQTFTALDTFSAGIQVSDGATATPSIAFTTGATNGLYYVGSNRIGVVTNGVEEFRFLTTGFQIDSTAVIKWGSGAVSTGADTGLRRIAAGVVSVSDGGTTNAGALQRKYVISAQTGASVTVSATADFEKSFNNSGAAGTVTFNLPAATGSGITYCFTVITSQNVVVDAAGTDTIQVGGSVSTAGGTATMSAIGSSITIQDMASGKWFAIAGQGSAAMA